MSCISSTAVDRGHSGYVVYIEVEWLVYYINVHGRLEKCNIYWYGVALQISRVYYLCWTCLLLTTGASHHGRPEVRYVVAVVALLML